MHLNGCRSGCELCPGGGSLEGAARPIRRYWAGERGVRHWTNPLKMSAQVLSFCFLSINSLMDSNVTKLLNIKRETVPFLKDGFWEEKIKEESESKP